LKKFWLFVPIAGIFACPAERRHGVKMIWCLQEIGIAGILN
jgi:hypothetical protein